MEHAAEDGERHGAEVAVSVPQALLECGQQALQTSCLRETQKQGVMALNSCHCLTLHLQPYATGLILPGCPLLTVWGLSDSVTRPVITISRIAELWFRRCNCRKPRTSSSISCSKSVQFSS